MRMNRLEKACMTSPLRALIQRHIEAPLLERLGGRVEGARVLEVGCGNGSGTRILFDCFGAARIEAIDLDPELIAQARIRLSRYPADRLRLEVGDATRLPAAQDTYDAVFDFAILHHIPNWQQALAEIHRVLKPGGRFFFEEVTAQWIRRWPYRALFRHPRENRFSGPEFLAQLDRQGLPAGDRHALRRGGDFLFGVGAKSPAPKTAADGKASSRAETPFGAVLREGSNLGQVARFGLAGNRNPRQGGEGAQAAI